VCLGREYSSLVNNSRRLLDGQPLEACTIRCRNSPDDVMTAVAATSALRVLCASSCSIDREGPCARVRPRGQAATLARFFFSTFAREVRIDFHTQVSEYLCSGRGMWSARCSDMALTSVRISGTSDRRGRETISKTSDTELTTPHTWPPRLQ